MSSRPDTGSATPLRRESHGLGPPQGVAVAEDALAAVTASESLTRAESRVGP